MKQSAGSQNAGGRRGPSEMEGWLALMVDAIAKVVAWPDALAQRGASRWWIGTLV